MEVPQPQPADLAQSLEELLQQCSAGDRQAFALLFDRTRSRVFTLALHVLRDWQLAEEVTLDVYMEVWRGAARLLESGAHVMGCLLTLTRHRSIDRHRARERRRDREDPRPPILELDEEPARDLLEPGQARESEERETRLRSALARLPEEQRRAIELAYFPGLSQAEVARRLGEPLGTIKSRIRLGMRKLKEGLAALEDAG